MAYIDHLNENNINNDDKPAMIDYQTTTNTPPNGTEKEDFFRV